MEIAVVMAMVVVLIVLEEMVVIALLVRVSVELVEVLWRMQR